MLDLWTRILDTMDRLMNSGQSNMLVEAVPETLKNVLLVMASAEHLIPPPASADKEERTEQQQQIWAETWTRTEKFMPGLMPELFPGAGKEPAPPAQPAQAPGNGKPESVSEDGSSSSQDTEESAPAVAATEAKAA
jgi:brefeldin A-resistance guanine nucleotide exchange factor 1